MKSALETLSPTRVKLTVEVPFDFSPFRNTLQYFERRTALARWLVGLGGEHDRTAVRVEAQDEHALVITREVEILVLVEIAGCAHRAASGGAHGRPAFCRYATLGCSL